MSAALLVASLSVTSAHAQESKQGFYVSPEIGLFKIKDICSITSIIPVLLRTAKCDDAKPGFGLSAGYRFNDYIAVEGGYRIANGFKVEGPAVLPNPAPGINQGDNVSAETDFSSLSLGLRGFIPLHERFSITPSVGWHSYERETVVNSSAKFTIDDSDLYIGLGAEFSASDNIAIRVSYSRFNTGLHTDVISGNIVIRF